MAYRDRLNNERLEVLRRPPNHLKKPGNQLHVILRHPLEIRGRRGRRR
jgi:hypothetical protein